MNIKFDVQDFDKNKNIKALCTFVIYFTEKKVSEC